MIWGAAAIVVGLLVTGTTDHNTVDMDAMSKEVQQMLDSITADTGYGIAFGYVGNDGQEISLGSGNRQPTEARTFTNKQTNTQTNTRTHARTPAQQRMMLPPRSTARPGMSADDTQQASARGCAAHLMFVCYFDDALQ